MNITERLDFFRNNFDTISSGEYSRGEKITLSDGDSRFCRFCQKDSTQTNFKNESHAIPECLGNHQLILLDECDACNKFFSEKLEDHLDKFTKPYRIAGQIYGKKGIPNYRSNNKKNRVDFSDLPTFKSQVGEDFVTVDHQNKQITVKYHQEPHVPLAVYKTLVKIAVSVIESSEVEAFRQTINWLFNPDLTFSVLKPALLMHTFVPGPRPIDGVCVTVLRRKAEIDNVPYAIFVIAFGNAIFQIVVPSHIDDGRSMTLAIPFYPTDFERSDWPFGDLKFSSSDLSGTVKVKKDFPVVYHFDEMIETTQKSPPESQ